MISRIKVCLMPHCTLFLFLMALTHEASSLQCFKCSGYGKEPYEDPACKTVVNCTDGEDSCWIYVIRFLNDEPQSYELSCKHKSNCVNFPNGCGKPDNDQTKFTDCTKCCGGDQCNTATTFQGYSLTPTNGPPTSSSQPRDGPLTFLMVTMVISWIGHHWITPGYTV